MGSKYLHQVGVMGVAAALAVGAAGRAGAAEPAVGNQNVHANMEMAQGVQRLTPSVGQEAQRATPSMLGTKLSPSAKGSLVNVRGQSIKVSDAQLEAYKRLPPEVQAKLGPAVNGQVLNAAELSKISTEMRTVMCAW